ncbi:MAG: hypothetical protein K2M27_12655 [Muribaculaceae bacterium]|nr:hypothetical protein [Muribaculaceae bacterium]
MGGNGSYDKGYGGIPKDKRTHPEIEGHRILGHKILVPKDNPTRGSAPMNCNSPDQIYMIGTVADRRSGDRAGEVSISSVAFYEGHHIKYSIDLKYDGNGRVVAFKENTGESTSHAHKWHEVQPGIWGRISRAKNNHLAPDSRWTSDMINAIETFNSKRVKWEKK